MTLLLSYSSKVSAIQMSDRLTTASGKEFDREANKTLVLVAPNGMASVSFCGLAFLKKKPADIFLAEALTGEIPDFFGKVPNMGPCLNNRQRKIDDMLHALRAAAEEVFANSLSARKQFFGLSVCGWRIRKGREEPFAYILVKASKHAKFILKEQTKRGWAELGAAYASHLPKGYVNSDGEKEFEKVASKTFRDIDEFYDEWERCFVETIRLSSKQTGLVGMDAMMVILPPPSIKKIAIKHIPVEKLKVSWSFADKIPAMFSPWIIGQRNFYAPSVIANDARFTHYVDDVKVMFNAPENTSGVYSMAPYKRRTI